MTGFTVRPLEWRKSPNGKDQHAPAAIGRYDAGKVGAAYIAMLRRVDGVEGCIDERAGTALTLEAAKAAAQADYERRILSAIETTPASAASFKGQPLGDVEQRSVARALDAVRAARRTKGGE